MSIDGLLCATLFHSLMDAIEKIIREAFFHLLVLYTYQV